MTEQISSGPAGTRRWPLPVIVTEPGDDGSEEVESSVQEFTGSAAHQVAFHAWQSAVSDVCAVQSSQLFAIDGPSLIDASRILYLHQIAASP